MSVRFLCPLFGWTISVVEVCDFFILGVDHFSGASLCLFQNTGCVVFCCPLSVQKLCGLAWSCWLIVALAPCAPGGMCKTDRQDQCQENVSLCFLPGFNNFRYYI